MSKLKNNIEKALNNYEKLKQYNFDGYFINMNKDKFLLENDYNTIFYSIGKYNNIDSMDITSKINAERALHNYLIIELLKLGNNIVDGPQ